MSLTKNKNLLTLISSYSFMSLFKESFLLLKTSFLLFNSSKILLIYQNLLIINIKYEEKYKKKYYYFSVFEFGFK